MQEKQRFEIKYNSRTNTYEITQWKNNNFGVTLTEMNMDDIKELGKEINKTINNWNKM